MIRSSNKQRIYFKNEKNPFNQSDLMPKCCVFCKAKQKKGIDLGSMVAVQKCIFATQLP